MILFYRLCIYFLFIRFFKRTAQLIKSLKAKEIKSRSLLREIDQEIGQTNQKLADAHYSLQQLENEYNSKINLKNRMFFDSVNNHILFRNNKFVINEPLIFLNSNIFFNSVFSFISVILSISKLQSFNILVPIIFKKLFC